MYILQRFTPLLVSGLHLFVCLFLLYQPTKIFETLGIGNIVIISIIITTAALFFSLLIIGRGHSVGSRLRFLPYLLISWFGGVSIFLFSENRSLLIGLSILLPVMIYLWLEVLYIYWQRTDSYQAYTLQRLANFLYVVALFLFVSGTTGLQVLVQIPMWITSIIVALVFAIMQFDLLQLHRQDWKESLIFAGLGSVLVHQLFIVLNLLPTHFYMYGLFVGLLFYVWIGIGTRFLRRQSYTQAQLSYVIIGSVGIVLLFISSLWLNNSILGSS